MDLKSHLRAVRGALAPVPGLDWARELLRPSAFNLRPPARDPPAAPRETPPPRRPRPVGVRDRAGRCPAARGRRPAARLRPCSPQRRAAVAGHADAGAGARGFHHSAAHGRAAGG